MTVNEAAESITDQILFLNGEPGPDDSVYVDDIDFGDLVEALRGKPMSLVEVWKFFRAKGWAWPRLNPIGHRLTDYAKTVDAAILRAWIVLGYCK